MISPAGAPAALSEAEEFGAASAPEAMLVAVDTDAASGWFAFEVTRCAAKVQDAKRSHRTAAAWRIDHAPPLRRAPTVGGGRP